MAIKDQQQLHRVLRATFKHVSTVLDEREFRLVGTAASLLHGVQLTTNDVDFLVKERQIIDRFDEVMQRHFHCLNAPTYLSDDHQYLASYEVADVEVEMSTVEWQTESDGIECFGSGPWTHFQLLSCGEYKIPTVALELRLISELVRDRADRYEPLIQYMQQGNYDSELIQRGMSAHGLSETRQYEILSQLRGKSGSNIKANI